MACDPSSVMASHHLGVFWSRQPRQWAVWGLLWGWHEEKFAKSFHSVTVPTRLHCGFQRGVSGLLHMLMESCWVMSW